MESLRSKVITRVSEKLPDLSLAQVEEYVDRGEEYFLTVTKRIVIPDRAFWLWVDISMTMYKDGISTEGGKVLSVKRGDTTVQYAESTNGMSDVTSMIRRTNAYKVVISR